jgi:hypothetical protein
MTLKEIEQTLLIDPDSPSNLPRVQAKVNVVRVCGPIVDVVDGYVQFVHFTVREYVKVKYPLSATNTNQIHLQHQDSELDHSF